MEGSITINSFSAGLSNDKNAGPEGSFFDCGNVDIKKNLSYVQLGRGVTELSIQSASQINCIALTNYSGGSVETEVNTFHADGTIRDNSTGEICKTPNGDGILNVANAQGYNWILGSSYIYRFTNGVRLNIIPTNTFSSGWTGTNWSFTSGATHTPGSTVALTQTSPITTVSGQRYHIICDIPLSFSGTCTVSIGGTTSSNLTVGRNDIYLTTSTTAGISFNPDTNFNGTIDYVRVDRVSDLTSSDGLGLKQMFTRTITNVLYAPFIVWNNSDIIYGSGNSVSRINKDGTFLEYNATLEQSVIGGLDGNVRAITQVGTNIYVWCNNGGSTNLYIWDGITSRPSEKIVIADKPVVNCALLNNQHYWWAQKGVLSQKYTFEGAGYQNNIIIKSDVPRSPTSISSYATGNIQTYEQDRLALYGESTNAIETFGDIVYLPGYGKLFGFGKYYPTMPVALDKSIVFDGTECTAMLTTSIPILGQDYTFYMFIAYKRSSTYYVGKIDMRDWNGGYASQGYIDTLEYMASSTDVENEAKKYTIRFHLPHASTSIKVYTNINQAGFTLQKTINTTDYGTGTNVAEVATTGKWDTLQYRFELITSNTTYSPRLYVGFKDIFSITDKK